MPTLTGPYRLSSGFWAESFLSQSGSLHGLFREQTWQPDQYQSEAQPWLVDIPWEQGEPNALTSGAWTFDFASIAASPEAVRLRRNLQAHGHSRSTATVAPRLKKRTSVLEFPSLNLGTMLRPLGPDDDLLGALLDEARP